MKTNLLLWGLAALLSVAAAHAQLAAPESVTQVLDDVKDKLTYQSADGKYYAHLSGQADLTEYYLDGQPFGLLYPNPGSHYVFAPGLTLKLDAAYGDRLTFFGKFRWDSGFNPGEHSNDVRVDEIYLRTVLVAGKLDFQVGKFATVFGSFVNRHDDWDNPLITAPLPYSQTTSVLDGFIMPTAAGFASIRNAPDDVTTWVPVIWGPAYTPSAAFFGSLGSWDLAVQASSQALSSRPETWNYLDFSRPSFTSRLGWRPDASWNLGVSGSMGPYLDSEAASSMPPGTSLRNYDQITVGGDASWAWHDWQVSGEFIFSRFQVPIAGNADTFSWYLETKYQITTQLYAAARWNQQVYNQINTATGPQNWDNDEMRLDLGLGYKWSKNFLTKIQYSWQHQETSFQNANQMVSAQVVFRF